MRTIDFSELPFETIKILRSLTTNIVNHPHNEKIRRVKTTHPKLKTHIVSFEVAMRILNLCGFVQKEEFLVLEMETDLTALKVYQKKIVERFQQLTMSAEEQRQEVERQRKRKKLQDLERKRKEEKMKRKKEKEEIMKKFQRDRVEKSTEEIKESKRTEMGPHKGKVHKLKINNARGG